MKYHVYYDRASRSWWGYWMNKEGDQLADALFAHQRDDLLVALGQQRNDIGG